MVARVLLGLGLTLTVPAQALSQSPAPDAPATVLVLDGSGSMWGRLDGDKAAKFYVARDALKTTLGKLKPETRVGMASFGHRRQADCADIQVLMQPEPQAGGEKLTQFLDKHNPKGKSPLANALREAAKALPKGSGPRSLIVVHDDLDNCGQDPCAALADMQASAPGLVVHAVGMGLKGDDAQRLQCLVKPTGGKLIDGQTAAAITLAIDDVFTLASLGGAKPPPPTAAVKPTVPAAAAVSLTVAKPIAGARAPLRKDGPSALRLATVLGPGQLPNARPVRWTVRRVNDAFVVVATGQDVSVPLAAGDYTVDARDGLVEVAGTKINIAANGETGLDLPLTAGLLRSSVPAGLLAEGLVSLMQDLGSGAPAVASTIMAAADLSQGIAVPPGKWIVRLSDGTRSLDRPAEIKAGTMVDLGTVWPFGRLQVSVAGDMASGLYPAIVTIYEDDPEAPRGRREVARSASTSPEMVLPAGTYAVVARQGSIEARDRVVVQGGETVKRALTLAGARLTLLSRLAGTATAAPAPGDEPVAYRIERLDVVPPEIFAANRQKAELELPAGRYRIEARHGLINARASREITLAAGQATDITLEQQAGTVRLTGPPGGAGDLLWEILDDTGHPLWSTAQLNPRATLQAGRYTIRLDYREKRLERRVEIRAGDMRVIDVRD